MLTCHANNWTQKQSTVKFLFDKFNWFKNKKIKSKTNYRENKNGKKKVLVLIVKKWLKIQEDCLCLKKEKVGLENEKNEEKSIEKNT